jgi:hypothetical protein
VALNSTGYTQLESALARIGSIDVDGVGFVDTDTVNAFQAEVTVTAVSNTDASPRAGLPGLFYNDGTPGGGQTGNIVAAIDLRHNGTALVAVFEVSRCDNPDCSSLTTLLSDDTTFGPVALGQTHTLSLAWDGDMQVFTFGFDGETVSLDPTEVPRVKAPTQGDPFKGIGTLVFGIDRLEEGAFIAATFDRVIAGP